MKQIESLAAEIPLTTNQRRTVDLRIIEKNKTLLSSFKHSNMSGRINVGAEKW